MSGLLVTGTGRSGTHYTARLLQALGLDVRHEEIGRDGAASWKHIVSGTFVYIGKNRSRPICSEGFTKVLHQVRHPLKVISSMQTFGVSTWSFMAQFIPLDLHAPLPLQGMQAWVGWNRLIESRAHWRFQIEQLDAHFPEFCHQVGLPAQPLPALPAEAADSRVKRYRPLGWPDLLAAEPQLARQVRHLALAYGYGDIAAQSLQLDQRDTDADAA